MAKLTPEKIAELLPCPFCGGAAQAEHFESKLGRWRWSIGCNDHTSEADDGGEPAAECYGFQSMTSFATKAEAIAAWNRRASLSLASASDLLVDDVFGKVYAHCVIKYDPKAAKRVIREALTMPSKAETFYAVQELDIDGKYQWCLVEIRPQQRRVVENFGFGRDAESKAKVAMNKREFIESKSKLEDGREVSADAAPLASASEGEGRGADHTHGVGSWEPNL